MQWSRVKSIFVIILLAVDSFLLFNFTGKYVSEYTRKQTLEKNMRVILAESDVALAENFKLPGDCSMPQLMIDRDRTKEADAAVTLLGGAATRGEEGGVTRFESPDGQANWDENGQLTAVLHPKGYTRPALDQMQLEAEQLLQRAGFAVNGLSWSADGASVTVYSRFVGYPVFNRSLTVSFDDEKIQIDGRWTFDTPYTTKSNAYTTYNPVDALLLFAQTKQARKIKELEAGLMLSSGAGNRFQLVPVWCIKTEKGEFYVDSMK